MEWRLPGALKQQRAKRALSMRALGAMLDVSHSTIADWEHARSYPSSFEVQRLAEALGVTICDLYGVDEGHQRVDQPGSALFLKGQYGGGKTALLQRFVEVLERNEDRIDLIVMPHRADDPPPRGLRTAKRLKELYDADDEEGKAAWEQFARELANQEGRR